MPGNEATRWSCALGLLLWLGLTSGVQAQSSPRSIAIGDVVTGVLSSDDEVEPYRGNYADRFTFAGYAGQRLEILLTSEVLDTYVILLNPAGGQIADDDDGGGSLDSRILMTLPLDGLYTVLASSYSREEGPYELLVREFRPRAVSWEPLLPGRPTHGTLTDSDATRSDNRRVDGYTFEGSEGDQIRIALESETFDAYLYLLGPTGEVLAENDDAPSGGSDSTVSLRLPDPGDYRVLVTSDAGGLGDYVLTFDRVTFSVIADTPIEMGESRSGRLESGDGTWSSRGAYADGYTFEGQQGQHVRIRMTSTEIDSYAVLLGPDGAALAENDDESGSLDALISTRLPSDGQYRVVATSYRLAEGPYLVRLEELDLRPMEPERLRVGHTVQAELTDDDPVRQFDPAHMDVYELPLGLGQRIVITMRSDAFNSFLWIVAPSGETLVEDDDSGGGLDALIEVTAPYEGSYVVVATTYAGLTGPYELEVRDAAATVAGAALDLAPGTTHGGRLEHGDAVTARAGAYQDVYRFEGAAGSHVEVRLDSIEIDPLLQLIDPRGLVLAEDDDGGGGLNSLIRTMLPEDGTYTLLVSSYSPSVGSYDLSVESYEPRPVVPSTLSLGDVVSGELTRQDTRSARHGMLVDVYRLEGEQGRRLRATMESAVLDPYLLLIDPNGEVVAEDDDTGGGLNARIDATLPLTGEYRLLATTASYGEGAYRLEVRAGPTTDPTAPISAP